VADTAEQDSGWLEDYRATAVQVLGSHLRSGADCSCCGNPWPCSAACAAEVALEL
jgi:hypothetical protein